MWLTRKAKSDSYRYANLVGRQLSYINLKKAIYLITNIVNGKKYIGQSVNPHRRFISHCSRARTGYDNSPIHSAIKKYGKENFILEIIEWTENYNQRERDLIKEYQTLSPNGYNICKGGESPPIMYGENHPHSIITEEQVDIIIAHLKERKLTESEIGKLFNPPLNQVMINSINFGNTHRRECEKYPIRTEHPYTLSEKEVDEIKWLLQNSLFPCSQIAEYYHVNSSTIKHINSGRNYFDENQNYPLRKFRGKRQLQPVETILAKRSRFTIDT